MYKQIAVLIIVCGMTNIATPSRTEAQTGNKAQLGELTWTDQKYFEKQRKKVDALTRSDYGRPIRGKKSDLHLLKRIIDDESIKPTDAQMWMAMGVVLGDIFAKELQLNWHTYVDHYGRSRGVCVPKTQECLFPLTMLSRRVKKNPKPDIMAIYEKSLNLLKPVLPKTPYSVDPI